MFALCHVACIKGTGCCVVVQAKCTDADMPEIWSYHVVPAPAKQHACMRAFSRVQLGG
jgi:hypothetical protein